MYINSEKDCDVSITYFEVYDSISLQENDNHGKFLKKYDNESYEFYPFTSNIFIVEINRNVFAGDSTLEFDKDIINKNQYDYIQKDKFLLIKM